MKKKLNRVIIPYVEFQGSVEELSINLKLCDDDNGDFIIDNAVKLSFKITDDNSYLENYLIAKITNLVLKKNMESF